MQREREDGIREGGRGRKEEEEERKEEEEEEEAGRNDGE